MGTFAPVPNAKFTGGIRQKGGNFVVFVPTGQLASPCAQLVAAECDIQDSGVYGLL